VSAGRILVVEDEVNLAEGIRENLGAEGYDVELAADGQEGLDKMREGGFDLVILDVMMPRMDGFTVCETVREEGNRVPVLFLTARTGVDDRIRGLEAGADDYIPKPFHLRELLLRVDAILRRRGWYGTAPPGGAVVRFGGNEIDLSTYQAVGWDGKRHELPEKEAMVLKLLVEREGATVSREEILRAVWGYDPYPATRVIGGLVERLRRRFERDPDEPRHLHTVRGLGYRFGRGEETDG
jgi:two-component system alkaline phosphatase synthesis response regulator PhoP